MESNHALCIICGARTDWEQLVPIKLIPDPDDLANASMTDAKLVVLSGACPHCFHHLAAHDVSITSNGRIWKASRR